MLSYGRPSEEHKAGMLIWGGREGGWEEAVRGGGRNIYIMRGGGPAARVTVSQKSAPPKRAKGPKQGGHLVIRKKQARETTRWKGQQNGMTCEADGGR